jgi:hypothetical protein
MEDQTQQQGTAVARIINGAGLNGLEEQTKQTIIAKFATFLERASEWEQKAKAIKVTDISQVEEMAQAREGRLILKNIRVEADRTRKELKEDSLSYGRAVQGVYNLIENVISPIEDYLLEQEKFAERAEAQRLDDLRSVRQKEMILFCNYAPLSIDLGLMTDEEYNKFFTMAKAQHEEELNRAEEAARKKKQEEEATEKERQRLAKENAALLEKQKVLLAAQREAKRVADEKLAEAERQRKEAEAKLREQQQWEKIRQDGIKAQAAAQARAERKEKRAPDKAKLLTLADSIDAFVIPSMKSEELQGIADGTRTLLSRVAVYIRQSIETVEKTL